jgi:hypothetical protein
MARTGDYRRDLGVSVVNHYIGDILTIVAIEVALIPIIVTGEVWHGRIQVRVPTVGVTRKIGQRGFRLFVSAGRMGHVFSLLTVRDTTSRCAGS